MGRQTDQTTSLYPWFSLTIAFLCLLLSYHCSVAKPNARGIDTFETWKSQCNCSCLHSLSSDSFLDRNCTVKNVFKIDKKRTLHKRKNNVVGLTDLTPEEMMCSDGIKDGRRSQYFLITFECPWRDMYKNANHENVYTIYKKERSGKRRRGNPRIVTTEAMSSDSTPNTEKTDSGGQISPKFLVIGLNLGLGVVFLIVLTLLCISCRRKKKVPQDEKGEADDYACIDEDEDSHPYRIVDLSTHVACDHTGYTFLDAPKNDEEKPYQKLNSSCSRTQQKVCTKKESDDDIVDADEPVYFYLEAKTEADTSS